MVSRAETRRRGGSRKTGDVFLSVPASRRETNQSANPTDLDSDESFFLELDRLMGMTHPARELAAVPVPLSWRPAVSERGFTLIEIIAVLLLMGILSVVAVVHSNNLGVEADVRGAAEVVKNHLRYAQTKAMNADLGWGINFAGSSYTLEDANRVSAILPGDLPQGMTYAATVNPVLFENRWGSPGSATITVTVSKGGTSQTITVTKNTGFIP